MPVPYVQTNPQYQHVEAKKSAEVPAVLTELFKIYTPQVATLPVDLATVTLRETEDGSEKRLEAAYEHNVLCLTYKFNTGAESLEILDLNEGDGQRLTLDENGNYSLSVGGMARTRAGAEFQGASKAENVGPEVASVLLCGYRSVIAVAEQHIR